MSCVGTECFHGRFVEILNLFLFRRNFLALINITCFQKRLKSILDVFCGSRHWLHIFTKSFYILMQKHRRLFWLYGSLLNFWGKDCKYFLRLTLVNFYFPIISYQFWDLFNLFKLLHYQHYRFKPLFISLCKKRH